MAAREELKSQGDRALVPGPGSTGATATEGRGERILERSVPGIGPALLVIVVALIVMIVNSGSLTLWATGMVVDVVIVAGMYTFIGNSGIMSFGHVAFVAIGAYTSGLLTIPESSKTVLMQGMPGFLQHAEVATFTSILIGGGVAALFAAIVCVPLMRMSGLRAAMATFAILQIVYFVIDNWNSVTLGTQGLFGVPTTTTLGIALIWAVIAIGAAQAYQSSKSGMRLKASREDESAAAAVGINIANERRLAFVISAFVVGVAGAIYGHWLGTFDPSDFYISLTFVLFAMLVVGGMTSLGGATLGVLVISSIQEGFLHIEEATHLTGLTEIVVALTLLSILVVRPKGISGGKELEWRWVKRFMSGRHRRGAAAPEARSGPEHGVEATSGPTGADNALGRIGLEASVTRHEGDGDTKG
jgi:branched-chain amino acid transport system permease protein